MANKKRGVAQPPAPQYQSSPKAAEAQHALEAWLSPDVGRRLALVEQIREGFPFHLVGALATQSGVALEELVEFGVIPRRTWTHSKQNQRFTPTQSARLARFFRVLQRARDTFGSDDTAMHWLKRPTKPLQNNAPVALLDTEEGARLVEDLLTRIDHGIAA
ncbi:MAG TPA: antitoxin Xre/MbcA/ParS toxin-binding domain-containing protein [Dongiaceae bacterium]|jgi:putative toxin-antitoxin system antitoxin component (TIGR02293 family)|nr:antitoxin Xre/MbcA/ParS toxin-binding domain-containing protein [Dongiaceae bacterium]